MKGKHFTGIIPALATPLNEDGTLREEVARQLLDFLLFQGADGFYVCGATGEGVVLDPSVRMRMCEVCAEYLRGKAPLIQHIAAIDMSTSLKLARHAAKHGADCVASIPPFYFAYGEQDILHYYQALAAAVDIPVMIYYHPAGGVQMSAKLVAEIFKIENVTAVKWSSTNYFEMLKLLDMTHGEMNVINGPDECLLLGLCSGAQGGIGSTYNVMLPQYKSLYSAFMSGDLNTARELQFQVNRVTELMIQEKIIPSVKLLLEEMGFTAGYATAPMRRFSPKERQDFSAATKAAGWVNTGKGR